MCAPVLARCGGATGLMSVSSWAGLVRALGRAGGFAFLLLLAFWEVVGTLGLLVAPTRQHARAPIERSFHVVCALVVINVFLV